jgi:hypothetical protein
MATFEREEGLNEPHKIWVEMGYQQEQEKEVQ